MIKRSISAKKGILPFLCTADNISLHLKNIYKEELDAEATAEFFSVETGMRIGEF